MSGRRRRPSRSRSRTRCTAGAALREPQRAVDVTRRDFLTLIAVAGGLGASRRERWRGARAGAPARLRGARQRHPAPHDRRARHAQPRLLPGAGHADRGGRRGGQAAVPDGRGAPARLWHRPRHGRGVCAEPPRLRGARRALRPDGRLRAPGDAGQARPGRAAGPDAPPRRRRHAPGLGDGALDARPRHGAGHEPARRRGLHAALGVHPRARARAGAVRRQGQPRPASRATSSATTRAS